ncbi:MAG: hypothetical protein ABIK62_04835, partial [candidate division WOR-3 bacterium]
VRCQTMGLFIARGSARCGLSAMARSRPILAAILSQILLFAACRSGPSSGKTYSETRQDTAKTQAGRVSAEVRVAPSTVSPGQIYTVSYHLKNGTQIPVKVYRILTGQSTLAPGLAGWTQTDIQPGHSALVAQTTQTTQKPGPEVFTATFVTDRGSYDAQPAQLTVLGPVALVPGRITARINVAPSEVQTGQTSTVTYELTDSTPDDVRVLTIEIDSSSPLAPGHPAWLDDRVPAGTSRLIARRTITKTDPGTYQLTAKFNTNRGGFTATPVTLVVNAPPVQDTGHVSARISANPNPCPVDARYAIDYEIVNTTKKDIRVTSISTDIGTLDDRSPGWRSSTAPAGRTTLIARVEGSGDAPGSRNKRATFSTSVGDIEAPQVIFIVQ